MTSHLNDTTEIVLGYGGYLKRKGLLNRYIRYETLTIALQYLGMAIRGNPYMGVGRNLAYNRSLFFKNKGFGKHTHVISGDDDLFVNISAVKKNTKVEFREGSRTRSVPCSSLKMWLSQKKRHLTTAPYYKLKDKFLLIPEPVSRLLFYISFIILLLKHYLWQYVLIIFGLRLIIQIVILIMGQKKFREPGILFFSVIFDIFSPLINGSVLLSNITTGKSKNKWK